MEQASGGDGPYKRTSMVIPFDNRLGWPILGSQRKRNNK